MTGKVTIVYANEEPPEAWDGSLFIAGPMPRTTDVPSWRPEAIKVVEEAWTGPGELVVFVPEPRDGKPLKYDHYTWEDRWLAIVDVILFWVPRDMQQMPGLTTNVEFGRWEDSGRVVLGAPLDAVHVGYLRECATRNGAPVATRLDEAAAAAITLIGKGSPRSGVDRQIPLLIWSHPDFQAWLSAQHQAGREILAARILWIQQNEDRTPIRWVMSVRVRSDQMAESKEFVTFGSLAQSQD
ncbi:hypothetical protein [Actinoplanes sp. NPDC051851]|uniref:hypothetical protein n=1 Tax=Actinoplanes sp. NPDC051851 TaxID=3154753 RepID=UPI00342AFA8A